MHLLSLLQKLSSDLIFILYTGLGSLGLGLLLLFVFTRMKRRMPFDPAEELGQQLAQKYLPISYALLIVGGATVIIYLAVFLI